MQVFKTFMKIGKKKLPVVAIYVVIFLVISIIMSANSANNDIFTETKLDVCVIDMDETTASKALVDYISSQHNLVNIETDKDSILDALYYQRADYVLTIKDGYSNNIGNGKTENLFTNYKVPGSYKSEFFDTQLNQYVGTISSYIAGGFNLDEAVNLTSTIYQDNSTNVVTESFTATNNADYAVGIYYYFQFLPYIFLSILIAGLCPILLIMTKKEIKNRTNCSCISSTSQTMQLILSTIVFVVGMWLLFMIAAFIIYGGVLFNTKGLLAILNSFIFLVVASGLTLFIAILSPNPKAVDMMANTIGLGMSFLCGIFVPQSLLGEGVLSVAKFLPTYWFVRANDMLAGTSEEMYDIKKYLSYLGIELAFAVALFAVVLLVSKTRRKSKFS